MPFGRDIQKVHDMMMMMMVKKKLTLSFSLFTEQYADVGGVHIEGDKVTLCAEVSILHKVFF